MRSTKAAELAQEDFLKVTYLNNAGRAYLLEG